MGERRKWVDQAVIPVTRTHRSRENASGNPPRNLRTADLLLPFQEPGRWCIPRRQRPGLCVSGVEAPTRMPPRPTNQGAAPPLSRTDQGPSAPGALSPLGRFLPRRHLASPLLTRPGTRPGHRLLLRAVRPGTRPCVVSVVGAVGAHRFDTHPRTPTTARCTSGDDQRGHGTGNARTGSGRTGQRAGRAASRKGNKLTGRSQEGLGGGRRITGTPCSGGRSPWSTAARQPPHPHKSSQLSPERAVLTDTPRSPPPAGTDQ